MNTIVTRGTAVLAAALVSLSLSASDTYASEKVDARNFVRAESDVQMKGYAAKAGGVGKF